MQSLTRRTLLTLPGLLAVPGPLVAACAKPPPAAPPEPSRSLPAPQSSSSSESPAVETVAPTSETNPFASIEARIGGRVGVFAYVPGTKLQLASRAEERFAMCSTFKWPLVAAVLERCDQGQLSLDEQVPFGEADLLEHAPVARARVAEGRLTLRELARAAIDVSDNTAANLLLDRVGGPAGLTAFFRRFGDDVSRLDRNEPLLNMNAPNDPRDTTSPRAMAQLVEAIMTRALSAPSRELLESWLVAAKTGTARLRAGLPPGLRAGDKTGTCGRGACNDVAMVWPPAGAAPWIVASYLSDSTASLDEMNAAHAEIAHIAARRFG